jgi:hypothetical protein
VKVEDVERLAENLPNGFDPVAEDANFVWGMGGGDPGFVHVSVGPLRDRLYTIEATCEERIVAAIIRDVVGNPFRPVAVDPFWLTPSVVAVAQSIYEDRRFEDMPILADALEEAGCHDADILAHCRSEGPHFRGCWAVDLLLGKE